MSEMLMRVWENLIDRVTGPMHFRLLLQPTMAAIFAIRAGIKDGREGRPAYLWSMFTNPADAKYLIRDGWKDIAKVFMMAMIIDAIYQLIELRWFYPLEALIVAVVLAIIPYLLLRGPANRIARLGGQPSSRTGAPRAAR
jgi:hypothetical protein